ncbi:hypothetical protein TYRP_012752 [Tyrophagus putrescentiae]|nr:hypothetical protein TYRP_012752 [Tyrophagus putrescentiae]
MDRLLVHQIVSGLSKFNSSSSSSSSEGESSCKVHRLEALIDRLLTTATDPTSSLGQVLWYCVQNRTVEGHQLAAYLLNRLVEINDHNNQDRFKVASVVNYVHSSACRTPLHLLAVDFSSQSAENHLLIERFLALGADALRADVHGLVPLHLVIRQMKEQNDSDQDEGEVIKVIGLLLQAMIKQQSEAKNTTEELLRKLAIVPAAIDADSSLVLEMLDQAGVHFSRRLIFEYLEYALQADAGVQVTGHLLKKLKSSSSTFAAENALSPIGLTLQYNNHRALLQAIELDREHFPVAKQCFHYLLRQLVQHCTGPSLASPATIRLLWQFTTQRLTFKVLHRPSQAEVVLSGNLLSYALLRHCGSMAIVLATLPLPVQFPVEGDVLLPYYRFSRHDVPAWRSLHRQNRLPKKATSSTFFRTNCRPLYDNRLTTTHDDLGGGRGWLEEEEQRNGQGPRVLLLSTLARNAFVGSLAVGEEGSFSSGEEVERRCQAVALRCATLQQLLGRSLFADLLRPAAAE